MKLRAIFVFAIAAMLSIVCACTSPAPAETRVLENYAREASLFDAPFPSEDLRLADGHIDLAKWPNVDNRAITKQARALLARDAKGFAQTAAAYFQLSAPIRESGLPDVFASTSSASPVLIMNVDNASAHYGSRAPLVAKYMDDGGPFGAPHMLALLPYQGFPLDPGTLYAAVVKRSLLDANGSPLAQSSLVKNIDSQPSVLSEAVRASYKLALTALGSTDDIAAIAVFRTDSYFATMDRVKEDALSREAIESPFKLTDTFPEYCVYATTMTMPDYQDGTPPYSDAGGQWRFDASGKPILQRTAKATVAVTIPRKALPAAGFPTVVFSRTGAGGERPLVDRGARSIAGGEAIAPGTGPALEFARAGYAAISVDGPLGGLRNPNHGDEQFAIFNISNPGAIRDNLRQSALELQLVAHLLDTLAVNAADCSSFSSPDASARFDTTKLALFGHSMGATIAPLALAFEPRFGAAILSGEGGSWIENILYKERPLLVRGMAEILIGYLSLERKLTEVDPALSLVQWAAEAADPPVYGSRVVTMPNGAGARHLLMVQGIVDHYILPPIANASSLSFGLDLAGPELQAESAELKQFTPLSKLLVLSGRSQVALPTTSNIKLLDGKFRTAVVVQHAGDAIEDGHEVIFQRPEPKYQYRCFLSTFARDGVAQVPLALASEAVCP